MYLPPGTRTDDLLVLGMLGGVTPTDDGSTPPPRARVPDSRMQLIGSQPDGTLMGPRRRGKPNVPIQRNTSLWVGRATEGGLPYLEVELAAGGDDLYGQFAEAVLLSIRDDDGGAVEWDGRVSSQFVQMDTVADGIQMSNASLPGLDLEDGAGAAALCMIGVWAARIGGIGRIDGSQEARYAIYDYADPPWVYLGTPSGYAAITPMLADNTDDGGPVVFPRAVSPKMKSSIGWHAIAMGLRVVDTPVTRQHPRDDGRGLSSAPRLYPPPKSGRVVGGHQ